MTVYVDELNRIMVEIQLGWEWGDPESRIPQTPEHEALWRRLEGEIADIDARGRFVTIPNE